MPEFAEPFRHGWRQSVQVHATLFDVQSEFQHIQVLDTVPFGRMLVLDDACQTSETDEYIYHEMLVHVPMMAHPRSQAGAGYRWGRWRLVAPCVGISG